MKILLTKKHYVRVVKVLHENIIYSYLLTNLHTNILLEFSYY